METFDWEKFTLKIAVGADMQTVYDAWAVPSEIEKWFLSEASYQDRFENEVPKDARVEKAFTYAWRWFTYDLAEYGTVTEANGIDFFQFTFAGECMVDVKLSKWKDQTLVELTQHNIPTDERSKQEYRLGCHSGWSFFLVNLKAFYEGGLDLRNRDNDLKGTVNS